MYNELINANSYHIPLASKSVHMVCCSPPFWKIRKYKTGEGSGWLGWEKKREDYVANIVAIGLEIRRVLVDDGVWFINLGDTYIKKQLQMIPARVAISLQDSGWILRSDIIWKKLDCMPDGAKDRPTKEHEYVFLLAKQKKYYYDYEAILEEYKSRKWVGRDITPPKSGGNKDRNDRGKSISSGHPLGRNRRTVWGIGKQNYGGAHFAAWPEKLVEPMIKAGCPKGGVVLDAFVGTGTTGKVAKELGRGFIGIDLSFSYLRDQARVRIGKGEH